MTLTLALADAGSVYPDNTIQTPYAFKTALMELKYPQNEYADRYLFSNTNPTFSASQSDYVVPSYLNLYTQNGTYTESRSFSAQYSVISTPSKPYPYEIVTTLKQSSIHGIEGFVLEYDYLVLDLDIKPGGFIIGTDNEIANSTYIYMNVLYSGNVAYPTKAGGVVYLPFTHQFAMGGMSQPRTMIAPCDMAQNGNPNSYHSVYSLAYRNASEDVQKTLVDPSEIYADPALVTDYMVYMYLPEPNDFSAVRITQVGNENGQPLDSQSLETWTSEHIHNTNLVEDFDIGTFFRTVASGVLDTELFPGFYLSHCLGIVIALAICVWVLKVFVGG